MAKIKRNAAGTILRNVDNKIVNECGGVPCPECNAGTMGTVYRITIPLATFTNVGVETCASAFNGATFDLTIGHPFYAGACARALDISGIACTTQTPDAIVLTQISIGPVLDFIFGVGNFIRFMLTSLTAPYDCSLDRTVTYDSTTGSPPIDSVAGKTILVERLV